MSGRSPLVGITTERETARWLSLQTPADLLPARYADAVLNAGGTPVLLPLRPGHAAGFTDRLDALIVSGGPDIVPDRYGSAPHPSVLEVRPERDDAESDLLRQFLTTGRPVLAICRGMQLLNVLHGGTLVQHLPDVLNGREHRGPANTWFHHHVALLRNSRTGNALGPHAPATCRHHQAVDRVGDGLRVVGRSADGVIEALELAHHPFAVGVQWHPEEEAGGSLFRALVAAAGMAQTECRPGLGDLLGSGGPESYVHARPAD